MNLRESEQVMNQRGEVGYVRLANSQSQEPFMIMLEGGRGYHRFINEDGTQTGSADTWMPVAAIKVRQYDTGMTPAEIIEKEFAPPEDES